MQVLPRNFFLSALISLCSGCAISHRSVWVDVDGLLRQTRASPVRELTRTFPPPGIPALKFSLSAEKADKVDLPGVVSSSISQKSSVVELQDRALALLRRRLMTIYAHQADIYAEQQLQLLGEADQSSIKEMLPKLYAAFKAYAEKRGPLVCSLVDTAGFPDPNPSNAPPPVDLKPVPKQSWQKANQLRDQISALDKKYDAAAEALVAEAGKAAATKRLALLKEIEDFRNKMTERALSEAVDPMSAVDRSVSLSLAGPETVLLPPTASESVSFPSSPPMADQPRVDSQLPPSDLAKDRSLVQRQLRIWLAATGCTLAARPSRNVHDATREFQDWRRQQGVGP